jgi:beta-glucanase (GH16 family)
LPSISGSLDEDNPENSSDSSSSYSTYLTLRTARTQDFQSAAEFDSTEQNFHYLSARFLARVIGSPGSCAGMFTYLASSPVQEADIEILTSGPREVVQYTNQPSNSPSGEILTEATSNASIPGGLGWSSWNTYRVDWMPTQSSWYVNGQSVANISFQVPRDPAGLIVNMWGDGGPWTGNMSIHDAAYLQIQYIEIVYNTSGPYSGSPSTTNVRPRQAESTFVNDLDRVEMRLEHALTGETVGPRRESYAAMGRRDMSPGGCKVICSVDEGVNASSVGTPVVLYNNTGASSSYRGSGHWSSWIPGMLLGVLVGFGLCL